MKAFLIYQLEVAVCLAVFYLFYQMVLRRENQFLLQRIYLLFSIVASLVLPALTLDLSTTSGIPTILPIEYTSIYSVVPQEILVPSIPLVDPKSLNIWSLLLYIWLGGLVFFTMRLIISIVKIIDILRKSKPDSVDIRIKKTDLNVHSFSFFKFIVLNKKHDNSHARSIVLAHEHAHANQLHSLDVLICELLKCFQWFNPFAWLLGQKVIMNLEFLADQAVLKKYKDVNLYQRSLLQFAYSGSYKSLKIEFSKIHLKERFLMMNRRTKTIHPGKWLGLFVITLMIGFTVSVKGSQKELTEKVNRSITYLTDPAPLQVSAPTMLSESSRSSVNLKATKKEDERYDVQDKLKPFHIPPKEVSNGYEASESENSNSDNELSGQNAQFKESFANEAPIPTKSNHDSIPPDYHSPGNTNLTADYPIEDQPLFVIDDLVYEGETAIRALEQIGRIGRDNIEEISVMKGNSAEELYGSKARNGVVKIRLKDGLYSGIGYGGNLSMLKKNKKNIGLKGISIWYDRTALQPIFIIDHVEYSHEQGTEMLDEIRITEVEKIY